MKTTNGNYFLNFSILKQSLFQSCEKLFTHSFLLGWWRSLLDALRKIKALQTHVSLALQITPVAIRELASNTRHLVGVGFIVVGVGSAFFYHIFDTQVVDRTWFFLNWFLFFSTISEEMMFGFWAIGTFLLVPQKWALTYIPCTLGLGWSMAKILNYIVGFTFQVNNLTTAEQWKTANELFNQGAGLLAAVAGVSLALSLIVCVDYLVRRLEHLKRGNFARIIGMIDSPGLEWNEKEQYLKKLSTEYKNFNSRI